MQYFIHSWILFTYNTENIDVVWNFEGVWCISIYLDFTLSTNPNRFYLGIHRVKFKTSYHVCFMSHVPNTKPVMPAWLRCYEPCNGAKIIGYRPFQNTYQGLLIILKVPISVIIVLQYLQYFCWKQALVSTLFLPF